MTGGLIAALLAFPAHAFDDGCSYVALQQACLSAGGMLFRELAPFQYTTTTSTLSTTATTALSFDCSAGYNNRELSWPHAKREWCCSNQQVGCPSTSARTSTATSRTASSTSKTTTSSLTISQPHRPARLPMCPEYQPLAFLHGGSSVTSATATGSWASQA